MDFSRRLSQFSEWTGRVIAWVTLPMVVGTFVIVVLRYAFDLGWIWMQEGVVWIHSAVFMLASAYTLKRDEHVRVDIFYREMSPRRKAIVNAAGTVLFLLPLCAFLAITSWDYVAVSWSIHEGSREAGGLPYPFTPLLKTLIPMTAVLVAVQGVADVLASIAALRAPQTPGQGR